MSYKKSPQQILDAIKSEHELVSDTFKSLAGDNGKLDNQSALEFIGELGHIVDADLSDVKYNFSEYFNKKGDPNNQHDLTQEEFMELFVELLDTTKDAKHEEMSMDIKMANNSALSQPKTGRSTVSVKSDGKIPGRQGTLSVKLDENGSRIITESHPELPDFLKVGNPNKATASKTSIGNVKYQTLWTDTWKQNEKPFEKIFEKRVDPEKETAMPISQFFATMKEIFESTGYRFVEDDENPIDFFAQDSNNEYLLQMTEKYMKEELKFPYDFHVMEVFLVFDELYDIIDYILRANAHAGILPEGEVKYIKSKSLEDTGPKDVRTTIEETIKKYEQMRDEVESEVEREVLDTTIKTLKRKIHRLNKAQSSGIHGHDETATERDRRYEREKEEKKMRSLREVFDFYRKQMINVGRTATFQRIQQKYETINLGMALSIIKFYLSGFDVNQDYVHTEDKETKRKFLKLRNEFKKKLDHQYLTLTYNRISSNHEDLNFEEFVQFLEKIAVDRLYKDEYKTEDERKEALWIQMGLYDNSHRKKMKYTQVPFHSTDKERVNPDDLKYKFKQRGQEGKTAEEIQEEVKRRNELRKLAREQRMKEKHKLQTFRKPNHDFKNYNKKHEGNYAQIQFEKNRQASNPEYTKLTLKKIGKFNMNDVRGLDDNFNPIDLIEENDEDDNVYLAEYNLQSEKQMKTEQQANNQRELEEYGKIRQYGNSPKNSYSNLHNRKGGRATLPDIQTNSASLDYSSNKYLSNTPHPQSYGQNYNNNHLYQQHSNPDLYSGTKSTTNTNAPKRLYPGANGYEPPLLGNGKNQYLGSPIQKPSYGGPGQSVGKPGHKRNLSLQYYDRAAQVESDMMKKEHQMMNYISNTPSNVSSKKNIFGGRY